MKIEFMTRIKSFKDKLSDNIIKDNTMRCLFKRHALLRCNDYKNMLEDLSRVAFELRK